MGHPAADKGGAPPGHTDANLFPVTVLSALDFTAISFDPVDDEKGLFYLEEADFKPLVLRDGRRSLPGTTQFDEDGFLNLYVKNEATTEDAPPFLLAGRAAVDPRLKRVLIFISRNQEAGAERFGLNVMEDEYSSFPGGSFRFINLSGLRLGILMGDEKVLLPDREIRTVAADLDEGNYVQVELVGEAGYVYQSTWYAKDSSRELVVLLPDGDGESVRLAMFSQKVP